MANLTLTIDDDLLRQARIRALRQGTSVNALVRTYLESLAAPAGADPMSEFLRLAATSEAASGPEGRTWRRDDLYDR